MPMEFHITSNAEEVLKAKDEVIEKILETWGLLAESHAIDNITAAGRIDSGELRNSISHHSEPSEKTVYIGTNVEYAVYNEIGTGIYLEGGGGRQTPWRYQDEKGNWHVTRGMKPIHFLRDAIQEHLDEYQAVADQELRQG